MAQFRYPEREFVEPLWSGHAIIRSGITVARSICIFFLFTLAYRAEGASTATWELNSWQDFVKGKFTNVALSRDGRMSLAPALTLAADTTQPAVWAAAPARDGGLYLGTGHRGRVYHVAPSGKSTLIWTATEPEVFALATDSKGVLYAATSPDGKIYRLDTTSTPAKATAVFDPKARYVWSLAIGPDGTLYAGTGDQGKVFALRNGTGELWYDTGQAHITSLALDGQGRLLAGTEPNGILYRITAKEKAFVLYDSPLPEIRAIALAADGSVYAAGLGGSLARRVSATSAAGTAGGAGAVVAPGTSITVTEDAAVQAGLDAKPKGTATSTLLTSSPVVPATLELAGVEKSAIYKISPDHTVETLWTSKDENIFDLHESAGELTFATDMQGRIYRYDKEKRLSLLGQTTEGEVTRLIRLGEQLMATTSNAGKLFRLSPASGAAGVYESPVHDASSIARWGKVATHGTGNVRMLTRSGNSARPDRTWSDWELPGEGQIASPNARYLQWKAEWATGDSATLESLRAAYLPQNTPPVVKSIAVTGQTMASTATTTKTGTQMTSAASAVYSLTVTDTGEASTTSTGTPTQTVTRTTSRQLLINWTAEDSDADPLLYALYYRGEGERRWKLLRGNMAEAAVAIDSEIFVDGRYQFRVVASDKGVNAAESAREAELISAPVLVDNTPPLVEAPRLSAGAAAGQVRVELRATDAASEIKRCDYSLDAGPWTLIEAADGVTDSPSESFVATVATLPPGEHVLVFRVADVAGNVALRKLVIEP